MFMWFMSWKCSFFAVGILMKVEKDPQRTENTIKWWFPGIRKLHTSPNILKATKLTKNKF